MRSLSSILADVVLVLYALMVVFNVGALRVIWICHFRAWAFVRNFYFRLGHLALIGIVALESVLGIWCPRIFFSLDLLFTCRSDALFHSTAVGFPQLGRLAQRLARLVYTE